MQEHQIERYFDIYFTNLSTTLGQLSAVAFTTVFALPIYYYYARINWYYNLKKKY